MKGSEKIALSAAAFGSVIAGGAYWLLPIFPWWVYAILGFSAFGTAYDQWLKMVANEKMIDRGDWPTERSPQDHDASR